MPWQLGLPLPGLALGLAGWGAGPGPFLMGSVQVFRYLVSASQLSGTHPASFFCLPIHQGKMKQMYHVPMQEEAKEMLL